MTVNDVHILNFQCMVKLTINYQVSNIRLHITSSHGSTPTARVSAAVSIHALQDHPSAVIHAHQLRHV